MALTLTEFYAGLAAWPWTQGLHNRFYQQIGGCFGGVFNTTWWNCIWPHLHAWRATRSGGTKAAMTARAMAASPNLSAQWTACCVPILNQTIMAVTWGAVAPFVAAVAPIKPVRSPVFRAKLSHFLLPRVFPVVDGALMGFPFGKTYREHFVGVQTEWRSTPSRVQNQLQAALRRAIGAPLTPGYPQVNKVVEVCLMGRSQMRRATRGRP